MRRFNLNNNIKCFKIGIRDGLPIFLGYLAVSFTLGIAAKNAGLNAFQASLMSFLCNASAGEFAALTIISSGASYFEMAFTQLVVNIRYLLMSCALSQKFDDNMPFFHRPIIAYDVTDEIFGVSVSVNGKLNPFYTYGLICIALPGWTLGTCVGVIFGNILPVRLVSALSVALYGMFTAVIVPPAKHNKTIAVLIAVSMLLSWLFSILPILNQISSGFKIVILTVMLSAAAAFLFPVKENTNE